MSDDSLLPLSQAERALLNDPLRAPDFTSIALTGRRIEGVRVQGLTWKASSFAKSAWREAHFVDCTFVGVDFTDTELRSVQFESCRFGSCRFERTLVEASHFSDCTLEETFWRDAQLECGLERSTLAGAWFESSRIRLLMQGGALAHTRFTACAIGVLQLTEMKVEALRFSSCTCDRLVFQLCGIEGMLLSDGSCKQLLVYGGMVRGLRLGEVGCEQIGMEDVAQLTSLHINTCQVESLALTGCGQVDDLYVFESTLGLLSVTGGRLAGWFAHCTIRPGSYLQDAVLRSVFWDDSICEGLTLRGVTFEDGICARRAQFTGLRLIDVRYAPDLDVVLDGATFEQSDTFPGSPA